MSARNLVVAGDYIGYSIIENIESLKLLLVKGNHKVFLNKNTIEDYELYDYEKKKSTASVVGRGLAGSILLGPAGLLAGFTGKNKEKVQIVINFKTGERSLLEVDGDLFKRFKEIMF